MKVQASDHHVDELWLPYLEGLLSPEERSNFEDHLHQCPACTSKLEEMSRWVSIFKDNAREMCPDGWQLFDYARTGLDHGGIVSSHLEKCSLCSADAEAFKAHFSKHGVPADLWQRMKSMSGQPPATRSAGSPYQWVFEKLEGVRELFRPAVLAPVAVAVLVMVIVLWFPRGPVQRMVALSSVKWGPEPSGWTLMGPDGTATLPTEAQKQRLGVVILLNNVKHLPDQNRIDYLYKALEPPKEIRDRYEVVSPEELKRVAGEDLLKAPDDKALVEGMRSKLKISKAFVIEIVPSGDRYGISARLIDAASGRVISKWDSWNLTQDELAPALEKATQTILRP